MKAAMMINKTVLQVDEPFWEDDGLDPAMWTDSALGEVRALRQQAPRTKEQQAELNKRIERTTLKKKVKLKDDKWHHLWVRIVGTKMSVKLDGKPIGTLDSLGINHQTRNKFGFTVAAKSIAFDDLKLSVPIRRAKAAAPINRGSRTPCKTD